MVRTYERSDEARAEASEPLVDPRTVDGLSRRPLFGLDMIDASSLDEVLVAVLERRLSVGDDRRIDSQILPILVTPNVDILVGLDESPDSLQADVFRRAQFVLPDGMPVVAASRFLDARLSARLPGSGLFELLWPRLAAERRPVVVLCASHLIARKLGDEYPTARFIVPPLLDVEDHRQIESVIDELAEAVNDVGAEFVLLGLGHPKDAILAARLLTRVTNDDVPTPLCLGLGGSFAMYAGLQKRAPQWMQRVGLEWFYRFSQEPRRLFHRYFVRDTAFIGLVARERRRVRAGAKG